MPKRPIDTKLAEAIAKVTGKRPRTVLEFIVEHGQITNEDLLDLGYNHPPRAIRDVREAGIPLETFRVRSSDGRSIGAYRLGDPSKIQSGRLAGRQVLSKQLLETLYAGNSGRCDACGYRYEKRYLQIDHRIPYEVAGEADESNTGRFMLLCGTCQRKKSWSCEHCPNWTRRDPSVCGTCYWAQPEVHEHVATTAIRRLELVFDGADVKDFDQLRGTVGVDGIVARLRAALRTP